MCWRGEKCIQDFGLLNLKGRNHLKDLHIDGRIMLELILGNTVGNHRLDSSDSG
jgi:hypothetical protein